MKHIAISVGAFVLGLAVVGFLLRFGDSTRTILPTPADPVPEATPALPQRVVCISPSLTEIIFALGQGNRVVGIGQYTTCPPEALDRPVCGGFVNPDGERILTLHPDLIVTQEFATKVIDFARAQKIPLIAPEMQDLESVFHCISVVGKALGAEKEATELSAGIRRELDAVREQVKDRPKPRVFITVGREPGSLANLLTAGKGCYLTEALELAGGRNIFGDVADLYPTPSKEEILQRQPEVIIELTGEGMADDTQRTKIAAAWSAMPTLPAVKTGRIVAIGETYAMIPGPRVTLLARRFAEILHGTPSR